MTDADPFAATPTDADRLVLAILDAPGESDRLLVYADWLEEAGHSRHAALVREVAALPGWLRDGSRCHLGAADRPLATVYGSRLRGVRSYLWVTMGGRSGKTPSLDVAARSVLAHLLHHLTFGCCCEHYSPKKE